MKASSQKPQIYVYIYILAGPTLPGLMDREVSFPFKRIIKNEKD